MAEQKRTKALEQLAAGARVVEVDDFMEDYVTFDTPEKQQPPPCVKDGSASGVLISEIMEEICGSHAAAPSATAADAPRAAETELPASASASASGAVPLSKDDEQVKAQGAGSLVAENTTLLTPGNHEISSGSFSRPETCDQDSSGVMENPTEGLQQDAGVVAAPELEVGQKETSQRMPANLGASILQRDGTCKDVSEDMLIQQREMARLLKRQIMRETDASRKEEELDDSPPVLPDQETNPVLDDSDLEHKYELARRQMAVKQKYGTVEMNDEIQLLNLESAVELQRKKNRSEASEMFVEPSKKRKRSAKSISKPKGKGRGDAASESGESSSDLDVIPAKRSRGRSAGKKAPKPKAGKQGKNKSEDRRLQKSSFGLSNIFDDAQAAEEFEEVQPGFEISEVGNRRANALSALVRHTPAALRANARTDKAILNEAIKEFTGQASVRPADGGKWLVNGMNTPLTPHQVISTGFMRKRECGTEFPKGGILADQMGLGKTLMVLANIVNGRPGFRRESLPEGQIFTTLIVVAPTIITQWKDEIKKHTKSARRKQGWGYNRMLLYRESTCGEMEPDELLGYDIILTSYTEVSKSWPVMDIPAFTSEAEKTKWLDKNFYPKQGILHKTKFLRICLDEAHVIRNSDTKVSQACRNLDATYHWAVTGTPMVNGVSDLYALLDFIKHPDVRGEAAFRRRFVNQRDPMSVDLLGEQIGACMSRFTHRNHLFGARLVNIPKARSDTYALDFSRLERVIYDIVRTRFATRVQKLSDEGVLCTKMPHIFVLLTRLRQLTSHPLMIQGEICSCLEREDFEKLEKVVERENIRHGDGKRLIVAIRNILVEEKKKSLNRSAAEHQDGADDNYKTKLPRLGEPKTVKGTITGAGRAYGHDQRFGKYLDAIKSSKVYQDMNARTTCVVCRQPPYDAYSTDCFHIYCKTCLDDLVHDAASDGQDKAACESCGKKILRSWSIDTDGASQTSAEVRTKKVSKMDDMTGWLDMTGNVLPSTKTVAAKAQILNWWDPQAGGDKSVKIIIFTQWLGMVKVLRKMCQTEGWGCCYLTGELSQKQKDKAIKSFQTESDIRILISSLKCGGIGLNLTVASKVIILDPWWNQAVENQAFCRVFRIGQTRETNVVSFAIKNSIDDRVFQLKNNKTMEIDSVMLSHKKLRQVELRTVLSAFGEVDEDENGRLYFTELNHPNDSDTTAGDVDDSEKEE